MKKHLTTLYITSEDAYIRKEHETFVVEVNNQKILQAPVKSIENIVCFGFKAITPALMAFCAENNVGISYLTEYGRFLARVQGAQQGNVLLRKAQYRIADDEAQALAIARPIVAAKVLNCRTLLQRHQRNHPEHCTPELSTAITMLGNRISDISRAQTLDELRGHEGDCASIYFSELSQLIITQKDDFRFTKRTKRPPRDPVNALLSFVYVLLAIDVRSAIETVGLDPYVGFLHRVRPGRPSLALDLMEEFRAYLGDRIMLNVINLKQITSDDFEIQETGEVRLNDNARKIILTAYHKRKQEEIVHPFLEEKMTIGLLPYVQAQLLARYIRGDISSYPPFYIR
ncbi:MAG: type I-C CRISPR-associated endonuclease Cas1c [Bacteroidetes bacterium]|nr:type I-C CRISPR-associated endonuclease Cas1c [Bacteroidota bacterium]